MHQPSARRMPKCHPVLLLGRASKTPQTLGDFNLHSSELPEHLPNQFVNQINATSDFVSAVACRWIHKLSASLGVRSAQTVQGAYVIAALAGRARGDAAARWRAELVRKERGRLGRGKRRSDAARRRESRWGTVFL